jgi:hypothetical protein
VLYEYCADARSPGDIASHFKNEDVEGILSEFVGREFVVFLDGRYLSLALPENPYL